jgi:thioredoxin-related protein
VMPGCGHAIHSVCELLWLLEIRKCSIYISFFRKTRSIRNLPAYIQSQRYIYSYKKFVSDQVAEDKS